MSRRPCALGSGGEGGVSRRRRHVSGRAGGSLPDSALDSGWADWEMVWVGGSGDGGGGGCGGDVRLRSARLLRLCEARHHVEVRRPNDISPINTIIIKSTKIATKHSRARKDRMEGSRAGEAADRAPAPAHVAFQM